MSGYGTYVCFAEDHEFVDLGQDSDECGRCGLRRDEPEHD